MDTPLPPGCAELAQSMADASGAILRRYFRKPIETSDKADNSPVTAADRETERMMRDMIAQRFPNHGIIGEEFGETRAGADYVWALDPLDGTAGFITGKPLFGTLIGLLHKGVPVFGLIDHPILQERWIGGRGITATHNGTPVHTRPLAELSKAMLYATTPHMFHGSDKAAFDRLCRAVKRAQYGADCYAYGLLASGFVDVVAEATMKPGDFCALAPVVEAAGGLISDWAGRPLTIHSDGRVLAAGNAALHAKALSILKGSA